MAPNPGKSPVHGRLKLCVARLFKHLKRFCRQLAGQATSQQRLHHKDGKASLGRGKHARGTRLVVLVSIVVLDLAEIPREGIQHHGKVPGASVKRKTYLANAAGALLSRDPILYP